LGILMPTFQRYAVRAFLYDEGNADPVVLDHGFGWWDNLEETAEQGTATYSNNRLTVEYLPGIGLTNRPRRTPKDLRLTEVSTTGGNWSEVRPVGIGAGRTYRVVQSDTTAGVQWSARGTDWLPADPMLAFSLIIFDTPPDWNTTTYPPHVRIELGTDGPDRWGVELSKADGNYLVRYVLGDWRAVAQLGALSSSEDNGESEVWFRVLRGQVGVSLDRGQTYTWGGNVDGFPATISQGRWIVRGQGGACLIGRHELTAPTGVFYSRQRAGQVRALPPTVSISGRYDLAGTSTITFADASSHSAGLVGYSATLTPQNVTAGGIAVYRCPVLYTVNYRIPTVSSVGTGAYTQPWDSRIVECTIDKPLALEQADCTLTLNIPYSASAWTGTYRNRKVQVQIGRVFDDASVEWTIAHTGYIAAVRPVQLGYGLVGSTITIANVAHRLRRTRWTPDYELALGSQTLGNALDQVLESEGVPRHDSWRQWSLATFLFQLPGGKPENPSHLTRRGEAKWDLMRQMAEIAQQELAVSDSGVIQTVAQNYVTGLVHDIHLSQDAVCEQKALAIDNGIDYRETVTAIYVVGEDAYGQEVIASGIDTVAELVIASGRFCPWREAIVDTLPNTTSRGAALSRMQYLAAENIGLRIEPTHSTLLNPRIGRRDEVAIYGAEAIGISAGQRHTVLSLRHVFALDPRTGEYTSTETRLGVRRS
jgi:hypothetical protein